MNTTYQVTKGTEILASIAKSEDGSHWATLKAFMALDPQVKVTPVVTITNACTEHPAFEADYCPRCGH